MVTIEKNMERIFPKDTVHRPHVETNYDPTALGNTASNSEKSIAVIGSASNGQPGKIYEISSLLEAKQVFGDGDIVNAAEIIWGPNKKYLQGGGTIYAMRVEDAQPAILNAPGLRFKSKLYGAQANKIQLALEQNVISGSHKLTIDYAPDDYHKVYDNLGQVFKMQYKANSPQATATYSVTHDKAGKADKFILDISDTDEPVVGGGELNPTTTTTTMALKPTTTTTTLRNTTTTTTSTVKPGSSTSSTTTTTTVKVPVKGFVFDTNTATVKTGDEVQLSWKVTPVDATLAEVNFATSDKAVATVDDKGHVVTLKAGSVDITGTVTDASGNTKTDTIQLKVADNATTDSSVLDNKVAESDPVMRAAVAPLSASLASDTEAPEGVTADATDTTTIIKAEEPAGDTTSTTTAPQLHTIHQEYDLSSASVTRLYDLMHTLSLIPNLEVQMMPEGDNTRMKSAILDEATDVDILGDINDPEKAGYVNALRGDIVDKLSFDSYVSVEAVYTEEMTNPFGLTNMVNGETDDVPLSWASQLKALAQAPAYYVVPLTSSAAVHQETKQFVLDQATAGHPMRAFVGAGFNEGIGNLISRQLDLKSERVALVGTSGYFETYDETTLHLPGYMVAALAAGVASGLQIGGDITNKYINMVSIDQEFSSSDIDKLYQNGVIVVEPINNRGTTSGFRFVAGITTYNSTSEPVKNKIGLGEVTDFLFGDLRVLLERDFIGADVKVGSADIIKNYVASFLMKEKMSENGLIVDYNENDIEVVVDGNSVYISFSVKPSQTIDYIYVYGAYENYTETSSNSTTASSTSGTSSSQILYGDTSDIPSAGNTDIKNSKNPDITAGYSF